jgi:hypothetical protein
MKIRVIVSLLVLFHIGCTDLDSDLYDRIPPEEYTADPILRMSPIYSPMRQFIDWGGWWFAQEITGDLVTAPTRGGDWDDGGKWRVLHQHTWTNNTEAINAMWGTYYDGALEANKFIEEMEALAGDPVIDEAIAKARILRAYYYYLLIDNYGRCTLCGESYLWMRHSNPCVTSEMKYSVNCYLRLKKVCRWFRAKHIKNRGKSGDGIFSPGKVVSESCRLYRQPKMSSSGPGLKIIVTGLLSWDSTLLNLMRWGLSEPPIRILLRIYGLFLIMKTLIQVLTFI